MWTDLAIASDERRDLSSLIQPGNRGVSVRASSEDKSFALIRPGDYVDVIATMPTTGTADTRTSIVLLQKVLVLAVGLETAPETFSDGKDTKASQRDMILTLSLDLRETQLLSLAVEKGKLAVALRNPDDPRVFAPEQNPDMSSTVLTDSPKRGEIGRGRPGAPVKLTTPGANK
jgi:pilus assembly protein CpaB